MPRTANLHGTGHPLAVREPIFATARTGARQRVHRWKAHVVNTFSTATTGLAPAAKSRQRAAVVPLFALFRSLQGGGAAGLAPALLLLKFSYLLISSFLSIHEDQKQREAGGHTGGFDHEKRGFGRPWRAFPEAVLRVQ